MHFPCNSRFAFSGTHSSNSIVKDSPQNTFATFLSLNGVNSLDLTANNLKLQNVTGGATGYQNATTTSFAIPKSGKWYYEVLIDNVSGSTSSAFISLATNIPTNGISSSAHLYYYSTGLYHYATLMLTVIGQADLDIAGIMVDMDNNEFHLYRNGMPNGSIVFPHTDNDLFPVFQSGGSGENITYYLNCGQDHSFIGAKTALAKPYSDANGIGEFYYPPPDGALAICTKNMESGLSALTTTKKYYNRDETGKVLSYGGYNAYHMTSNYGTINDERFSDLSPYGGKSLHFDGVSEVINSQASSDHNIGTGAFTMEIWFKTTSNTNDTYYRRMFMLDGPTGNATGNIQLTLSNTGYVNGWTNTSDLDLQSATGFNDGAWHHAALVRSGTTVTLYVDGTSAATATYGTAISPNSGSPRPRLGSYDGTQGDFDGYLADARLVVGTAVYTGNFTVPSAPLGTTQSSGTNIAAITGTATSFLAQPYNTETVNNTTPRYPRDETGRIQIFERLRAGTSSSLPMLADMSPYADNSVKSLYFDGYNNVAYKDNLTDFQPGTGAFTFECWLYLDDVSSNDYHTIFDNRDASGTDTDSFFFGLRGTVSPAGMLYFYTGGNYTFGDSQIVQNNTWHHVALVRTSTSSGGLELYLDGVGSGSAETMANDFTNTNNLETYLGALCDSDAYNLYGYMSDIRFVKGTAVYTGNFTPPSGKLTTTGGTYPSTTNVNTSITAGHTTLLVQPYSQPAQEYDNGSIYRTNRIYLTDETGNKLTYV